MNETEPNYTLFIERGQRLRELREVAGLNSTALAKLVGLSRASISYWENATRRGLTRASAQKIITALSAINVQCDIGWLWFGNGNPPKMLHKPAAYLEFNPLFLNSQQSSHNFLFSLHKEIDAFLGINTQGIIAKIQDDLMNPMYEPGDIVGGIWQPIDVITRAKNPQNIILKANNLLYVRQLTLTHNTLKISCINPNTVDPVSWKDIELTTAAPVIRVWKY